MKQLVNFLKAEMWDQYANLLPLDAAAPQRTSPARLVAGTPEARLAYECEEA